MYRYTPIVADIKFINKGEDKFVKVNANDPQSDYLINKLDKQNNSIDIDTDNNKLNISVNIVDCGLW